MGEIMFKPKDGGDWHLFYGCSELPVIEPYGDMGFAVPPTGITLEARLNVDKRCRKSLRQTMKRMKHWQKIHERRVLRKWQERWHKEHTL